MKIIIYIGHHKVGSTALQMFLSKNWRHLAQAGILYPSVEASGFSHNLSLALRPRGRTTKKPGTKMIEPGMNVREPHSALAYQMIAKVTGRKVPSQFARLPAVSQMLNALRRQVDFIQPETMILCSEVFANFGQLEPDLITQLVAGFPDCEIEIYCALRRPDEYLISWHGQRLKVGEQLDPLSGGGLAPYFDTIHFNFRTVIEAWNDRLGDARLIIRPYARILESGGSIDDFRARVGVDFPDGLKPVGRANQSLPRAAMEIVRRANHDLPKNLSHGLSRYFLNAGDTLELVANARVEMFGAPVRKELAKQFAPIHDYLSELTGGAAFFDDIDEVARECPVPQARATAELLARIDPDTLPNNALREYLRAQQDAHAT